MRSVPSDRQVVFNTGDPAYAVDRSGLILAWNDAASRAFGYAAREAVGSYCWKLLAGRDVFGNQYCCEHCPHREMASRHQAVNRSRLKFRTASGHMQDFVVSTLVLLGEPGGEILVHLCRSDAEESKNEQYRSTFSGSGSGRRKDILTPREKEVLVHLADGYSTGEISTVMCISKATVRNHIEHLLQKLHSHSRLEAVATARRLDLL